MVNQSARGQDCAEMRLRMARETLRCTVVKWRLMRIACRRCELFIGGVLIVMAEGVTGLMAHACLEKPPPVCSGIGLGSILRTVWKGPLLLRGDSVVLSAVMAPRDPPGMSAVPLTKVVIGLVRIVLMLITELVRPWVTRGIPLPNSPRCFVILLDRRLTPDEHVDRRLFPAASGRPLDIRLRSICLAMMRMTMTVALPAGGGHGAVTRTGCTSRTSAQVEARIPC
jgi:hypothetical protein